jgi:hypothetical protein
MPETNLYLDESGGGFPKIGQFYFDARFRWSGDALLTSEVRERSIRENGVLEVVADGMKENVRPLRRSEEVGGSLGGLGGLARLVEGEPQKYQRGDTSHKLCPINSDYLPSSVRHRFLGDKVFSLALGLALFGALALGVAGWLLSDWIDGEMQIDRRRGAWGFGLSLIAALGGWWSYFRLLA